MAERIGTAVLELTTDAASFNAGLADAGKRLSGLKKNLDLMAAGMTVAGKQTQGWAKDLEASGKMISGMSQIGRTEMERLAKPIERLPTLTQAATKSMVAMGAAVGSFVGTFAANLVYRGVESLVSMGKAAFDSAGNIIDLSNKTGLSTDAIQRMQAVANLTGASLDNFTTAAFQLGVRLSGGSDSVRAGVERLGLTFAELRQMRPEDQFEAVVTALGNMRNEQQRNEIGVALFGKNFATIAAAVAEGYAKMASGARVSTEAQLQALDKAGDRWSQFTSDTKASVTGWLGSVVLAFDKVFPEVDKHGVALSVVSDRVLKAENAWSGAAPVLESFGAQLKKAEEEASRLTDAQKAEIDSAQKLGKSTDELADRFGVSEAAIKVYTSQQAEATKAGKAFEAETTRQAKALDDLTHKFTGGGLLKQAKDYEIVLGRLQGATKLTSAEKEEFAKVFQAVIDKYTAMGPAGAKVVAHYTALLGEIQPLIVVVRAYTAELTALPPVLDRGAVAHTVFARGVTSGVQALMAHSAATKASIERLAELGMILPDLTIKNERVSESVADADSRWVRLGRSARESLGDIADILDGINNRFAQMAAVVARAAEAIIKNLAEGDLLGAIIAGATALATALGNIFGKAEGKKVNDMRDKYIDAAGGLGALNEKARAAGLSLTMLLRADTVKEFERAVAQLDGRFEALEQRAENAQAFLSDFAELMNAVTESGKLASAEMLSLLEAVQKAGGMTAETTAFIQQNASAAASGFNAVALSMGRTVGITEKLKTLEEERAELIDQRSEAAHYLAETEGTDSRNALANQELARRKISEINLALEKNAAASANFKTQLTAAGEEGQAQFDRLGRIAAVAFTAATAGGQTTVEAIRTLQPGLESLAAAQKEFGFQAGASFTELMKLSEFVSVNAELIDGVDGLNQMFVGLHNALLLDQQGFDDLTAEAVSMKQEMVDAGTSGDQAMRLMQPTLQTIWELQKDFGYAVDASTQEMLTQAEAAGVVGEAHRSADEQIIGLLEEMVLLFKDFVAVMGGAKGAADDAADAVGGIADRAGDIPDNPFKNWDAPEWEEPLMGDVMHAGGTIQRAHSGTFVRPRLSADEVPIIAQTGEGILSRRGMAALGGDAILNRLNAGASHAPSLGAFEMPMPSTGRDDGRPLLVRLEVDGVTLAERMVRHMPRALSHAGLA